jgi:site-specific DNA recombinase
MGRLTLNVLLSFAQFEREVIGERVRDKIAASKKNGMWMGGMPSLGYDVKDRKLVINEDEARTVVGIFRRYVALKSVHALTDELAEAEITSKRRVRPDGMEYGSKQFSRGALYLMLRIGFTAARSPIRAISSRENTLQSLWDEVQTLLADNRVARSTGERAKHPSLLAGLVFDETGERLTPTYTVKKGTRYRYYVSTALLTGATRGRSTGRRIPASDLEGLVMNRLRAFFADPSALLDVIGDESECDSGQSQLIERSYQVTRDIKASASDKVKTTLMTLRCRVESKAERIEIKISRHRITALLTGQSIDLTTQDYELLCDSDDVIILVVPARLKRVGREMKVLVDNDNTAVDTSLLRIIARAHDIQARLNQNTELTVHDIAHEEHVSAAYIYNLLRLPWLAPDITTAIVNGRRPQQLNAKTLMRRASRLPAEWSEQRTQLGFR